METASYITPRAAQIMDFVLQGMTSSKIAERLDLSLCYISTIRNAPQFQHQLSIRRERIENTIDADIAHHTQESAKASQEADRILREHAADTARNMVRLIDGDNDPLSLKASVDLLDRVGPQKRTGVNTSQAIVHVDIKAAMLIKETLEMDKGALAQVPAEEMLSMEEVGSA